MSNPLGIFARGVQGRLQNAVPVRVTGRVVEVLGTLVKAHVPQVQIGEICQMRDPEGALLSEAEVVGFLGRQALLSVYGEMMGLSNQTEVFPTGRAQDVAVGEGLLGRVLDGMGRPLDGGRAFLGEDRYKVYGPAPSPLGRTLITRALPLGVRALDALLTCGEGQRLGIFAAAGGGKSTLLASLILGVVADAIVVALIGERGREVREFIEHHLGAEGMRRTVVVVSTSDRSSMERARAAYVATAVAEYFRDQGRKVLLLMDSVTRFARALREIGLAAGEPPTRRGFPPSVFAALPRLMERAGTNPRGSITALYTVLVEGDDMTEPVADETRSILDGHIILSRDLAAANHYPAIDILRSASRVMDQVISPEHAALAAKMRSLLAAYKDVELLLKIGEYKPGNDSLTDMAVKKIDSFNGFLRQGTRETSSFVETQKALQGVLEGA